MKVTAAEFQNAPVGQLVQTKSGCKYRLDHAPAGGATGFRHARIVRMDGKLGDARELKHSSVQFV